MSYEKVGKCSLCGGIVMGNTGAFFGKPPPFRCSYCGATNEDSRDGVIRMRKPERSDAPDGLQRESQSDYFGLTSYTDQIKPATDRTDGGPSAETQQERFGKK